MSARVIFMAFLGMWARGTGVGGRGSDTMTSAACAHPDAPPPHSSWIRTNKGPS
jgi:hypothetical protein